MCPQAYSEGGKVSVQAAQLHRPLHCEHVRACLRLASPSPVTPRSGFLGVCVKDSVTRRLRPRPFAALAPGGHVSGLGDTAGPSGGRGRAGRVALAGGSASSSMYGRRLAAAASWWDAFRTTGLRLDTTRVQVGRAELLTTPPLRPTVPRGALRSRCAGPSTPGWVLGSPWAWACSLEAAGLATPSGGPPESRRRPAEAGAARRCPVVTGCRCAGPCRQVCACLGGAGRAVAEPASWRRPGREGHPPPSTGGRSCACRCSAHHGGPPGGLSGTACDRARPRTGPGRRRLAVWLPTGGAMTPVRGPWSRLGACCSGQRRRAVALALGDYSAGSPCAEREASDAARSRILLLGEVRFGRSGVLPASADGAR